MGQTLDRRDTYKIKSVGAGVLLDVPRQILAKHPLRDKLERKVGDAQEGDDIWVCQAFPHHSILVEGLRDLSTMADGENSRVPHFYDPRRIILGAHPNTSDTNL